MRVTDMNGNEIFVGAKCDGGDGTTGVVTGISDPDADHDGERFVAISPKVTIQWPDIGKQTVILHCEGELEDLTTDEVEVIV